jgi:hypothetical protein
MNYQFLGKGDMILFLFYQKIKRTDKKAKTFGFDKYLQISRI